MNSYTNIINTQQEDKGTQFFRLYESKDALYPLNQSNTTAYTLHTGNEYGDYKGIDLAKDKDNELTQNRKDSTNQSHTQSSQGFFHTLESLKQKYKDILESLKDDRGRIMIKVEVGYELYEFAKYFTFDEIIQTSHREFVKRGNNLQSLKDLCQKILDKLQAHIYEQYGDHKIYKLNINSGVRSDKLNESLNGSTTSQHSHCEAADIKQ